MRMNDMTNKNTINTTTVNTPSTANPIDATVVIPAYNEEHRIRPTLDALAKLIKSGALLPIRVCCVIVVNDGSADRTVGAAATYQNELPNFEIVTSDVNRGKGHAVRQGLFKAQTPWVLIADADMSTPWSEMVSLAKVQASSGADIVIASRDIQGSQITRHQSFIREFLGKTFNFILRSLINIPFRDTQCGFKLIDRRAISSFLPLLSVDRFAWDVEFLMLAIRAGLKISEVPVKWEHCEQSRVRIFRDGFEMLQTVIKLRFRFSRLGKRTALSESDNTKSKTLGAL